jgi:hypothetical protein
MWGGACLLRFMLFAVALSSVRSEAAASSECNRFMGIRGMGIPPMAAWGENLATR